MNFSPRETIKDCWPYRHDPLIRPIIKHCVRDARLSDVVDDIFAKKIKLKELF